MRLGTIPGNLVLGGRRSPDSSLRWTARDAAEDAADAFPEHHGLGTLTNRRWSGDLTPMISTKAGASYQTLEPDSAVVLREEKMTPMHIVTFITVAAPFHPR